MNLYIDNMVINTPIQDILYRLKHQLNNGKLQHIGKETNGNIPVTCPSHKNGMETHPSCQIYCEKDNDKVEYGYVHCFTCGLSCSLPYFISLCFNSNNIEIGNKWLKDNFGLLDTNINILPKIELNKHKSKILDESILEKYNFYHPYMWKRKLSKEVVDKFHIGYDKDRDMLVFPVWNENNKLVMLTFRSVNNKTFYIDKDVNKPVYLLNFINKENIKTVYVCESQINALTLWSWGYPAIALFGTGSQYQYDILNKSGIRNYILCFDGDEAGLKGQKNFIKNIRKDVLCSYKQLPYGKDVNDLSKEEFETLKSFY